MSSPEQRARATRICALANGTGELYATVLLMIEELDRWRASGGTIKQPQPAGYVVPPRQGKK